MAGTPESQYTDRGSFVRSSTRAADHSRGQVQSALDGLLSDDDLSQPRSSSRGYEPMDGARSPGPPGGGRRRSYNPPEPIVIDGSYRRDQSSNGLLSPTRKASAVTADGGGYTPSAAGGRRYALGCMLIKTTTCVYTLMYALVQSWCICDTLVQTCSRQSPYM